MKKIILTALLSVLISGTAMAFSMPKVNVDSKKAQMVACLSEQAQSLLLQGQLNKDNVEEMAGIIALTCATKLATGDVDAITLQLATTALTQVLK